MKIRPRNYITYAAQGVKFSPSNVGGTNWLNIFRGYRQHLLDQLAAYGEADDYGNWLNEMQTRHSNLYNKAGDDWENIAYEDEDVRKYQQDYNGSARFGSVQLKPDDRYDFNQTGIKPNQNTRYSITGNRTSGDFSRTGYNYNPDGMYSAITDDRRLLGRAGDWDENSEEYKTWQRDLNSVGWETYRDKDGYYKLRRFQGTPTNNNSSIHNDPPLDGGNPLSKLGGEVIVNGTRKTKSKTEIPADGGKKYGFDWSKIREVGAKVFGNPDLYAFGRLAGNLINNERVYDEQLKGINPVLRQSYNTYRQIVGDEATKQAYYRRAVQGQTKAAQPFTSDADRQIAYQQEAKRIGDELRAQGDLADNQEIRRTSDESNQHQWANIQRNAEVNNANIASINQANSLKHNLLSQKHSAQWSSIDNFSQGIEYRKRQQLAEDQELENQAFLLQQSATDPKYYEEYQNYYNTLEQNKKSDGTYDYTNPKVLEARQRWENYNIQHKLNKIRELQKYKRNRNLVSFTKNGSKLTYKKKDDLLYKSSKDVVEHFRKMSKMSSDAQNRKQPKIEKLTPHPKGKTKKYQQGGLAPFTIYKPVALGGETTTNSETSTSSTSGKSEKNETLDMIKELFKQVAGKGLPSDVNSLYVSMNNFLQRAQAFGEDINTTDIASMYLQQMQKLNQIQYLKANYDNAEKTLIANDGVNEFAVDFAGRLVGQNKNKKGEIVYINSLKEAKEKEVTPLTNGQLLQLRATVPNFAGRQELDTIASNGVGMSKIAKFLKEQLPNIGSSEQTIEGYTKKDSNDIKQGMQLLAEAPAGDYKFTKYSKEQQRQATMAINYLKGVLPLNMRKVIETRAELGGLTEDQLIGSLVSSGVSENSRLEFDAVTGKAVKDSNGNSSKEGLEINSAVQLLLGMSSPREFTFNIGNGNSFTGAARVSSINDVEEKPFGSDFSYSEVYKSSLRKILDLDNASFGDVPINKALKDRIIVDNSTIAGIDLPYTTDRNGRIIPDFKMLSKIEEADNEILKLGINPDQEPQKVNKIYAKHGLPIKYGANNRLSGNYKRFAVIQATAIEDVFLNKEGLASNGTLELVSDDNEIDKYIEEIKKITGKKDIDMDRDGLFTGNKDIYKGSIFIPIIGDLTDAISGSKTGKLTENNYDDYRNKYNTKNYVKASQYVKP